MHIMEKTMRWNMLASADMRSGWRRIERNLMASAMLKLKDKTILKTSESRFYRNEIGPVRPSEWDGLPLLCLKKGNLRLLVALISKSKNLIEKFATPTRTSIRGAMYNNMYLDSHTSVHFHLSLDRFRQLLARFSRTILVNLLWLVGDAI